VETPLYVASLLESLVGLLEVFAQLLGVLVTFLLMLFVYAALRAAVYRAAEAMGLIEREVAPAQAPRAEVPQPDVIDSWYVPSYSLALLVRVDEQSGRLAPSVQIRGEGRLVRPWIRLELVDTGGALRHAVRRRLWGNAIGTELALPAFEPPDGATAEEALGWHWDVVIEDEEGERARWREHPRAAGLLNAEAELV
jgi:hypothetical protein